MYSFDLNTAKQAKCNKNGKHLELLKLSDDSHKRKKKLIYDFLCFVRKSGKFFENLLR